jgi:hypothetical protein
MRREHVLHGLAYMFVTALVEHQNRRTGAAESAAQEPFHAQADYLLQSWHQRRAIGLVQLIFERSGKGVGNSGGQSRNQQSAALNIEDHVRARIGLGKDAARLDRRQQEIRHYYSDAETWMQFKARGVGDIPRIGSARDYRTVNASGDVIWMPLDTSGFVQYAPTRPAQAQYGIGDHDTGRKRGGAGPESFTERDAVIYVQLNRRHGALKVAGNANRGLPDQVVFATGYRCPIATGYMNRELVRGAEAAFQINAQSQRQRIEGWSEIGTGCGNPQFAKGQTAILTRIPARRPIIRIELQV